MATDIRGMNKFRQEQQMANENDTQIGGGHYKMPGHEEHWDRAWRLEYDCYQYIITKWVERWKKKGGIEDLRKARHALDKYIATAEAEEAILQGLKAGAEPGPGYVNQD